MAVHSAHYGAQAEPASSSWWQYALLGAALAVLGLFMLSNMVAATIASAIVFGAILIVGGLVEIFHAFSARGWGGFLLSLLVGLLYAAAGVVLLYSPVATSLILTLVFAALLVGSGIFRMVLAFRLWSHMGWMLLLSGIIGVLAGIVIFSAWPASGLWVLGLCLGIDFLFHGIWWLIYAWEVRTAH